MNKQIFGLGSFRLMLALFVAVSHLYENMIHGPAAYAVWGFYLLSGYLMALILNEKYGFDFKGVRAFFINRALRIYPAYLIALLIGSLTLFFLKKIHIDTIQFNPEFFLPSSILNWTHVVTVLPFIPSAGLPVSTSHALSLEIGMYLLAPLIARNKPTAWLCFLLSSLINIQLGFEPSSFPIRYATFLPCLLAFSGGSVLYHYKDLLRPASMPFFSLMVWFFFCLIWLRFSSWPWTFGLYFSLLLSAWVVLSLVDLKSPIDNILGDLSYPVYLFHVTIAALSGSLLHLKTRALSFCIFGVFFTFLISYFVVVFIEKPIRKIKLFSNVKNSSVK